MIINLPEKPPAQRYHTRWGVGSKIAALIKSLGLSESDLIQPGGCGGTCAQLTALLNRAGIEWCERNKKWIVEMLSERAKQTKLSARLGTGFKVTASHIPILKKLIGSDDLPFSISGIVDQAIEQAKAEARLDPKLLEPLPTMQGDFPSLGGIPVKLVNGHVPGIGSWTPGTGAGKPTRGKRST